MLLFQSLELSYYLPPNVCCSLLRQRSRIRNETKTRKNRLKEMQLGVFRDTSAIVNNMK